MAAKKPKAQQHRITINLSGENYQELIFTAKAQNRSLANLIETLTVKALREEVFVDDFEMNEILNNKELLAKLKQGSKSAKARRGRFV